MLFVNQEEHVQNQVAYREGALIPVLILRLSHRDNDVKKSILTVLRYASKGLPILGALLFFSHYAFLLTGFESAQNDVLQTNGLSHIVALLDATDPELQRLSAEVVQSCCWSFAWIVLSCVSHPHL